MSDFTPTYRLLKLHMIAVLLWHAELIPYPLLLETPMWLSSSQLSVGMNFEPHFILHKDICSC